MNDFTKDELETLRESNNIAAQYHGWKPQREALLMKLNAMIDDYCEHNRPYTKLGITVCLDCHEVIKNPDGVKFHE